MKILIIFVALIASSRVFSNDFNLSCENIRFEAQDIICNLEAKDSDEAGGETAFQYALKNKMDCIGSFIQTCNASDSCEAIQQAMESKICNLEAAVAERAAGTDEYKNALKRKVRCQETFLNICNRESNK